MSAKGIILMLFILGSALSFKIDIIDEDYVEVMVGNPQVKLHLFIDPFSPFTYIFSDSVDKSVSKEEEGTHKFNNIFGEFEGKWRKDFFFLTKDKVFSFKLKYLKVEKKTSLFNADGVLGLGYSSDSKYFDCSIYHQLKLMGNVFETKNGMSYDKRTMQLTIGEIPYRNAQNRVSFPLLEKKGKNDLIESYVSLSKIGFKDKNANSQKYINVNQEALLTLMPVLIAPEKSEEFLKSTILPECTAEKDITPIQNPEKFFTDLYYKSQKDYIKTELVFSNIAYPYKHTYKTDDGKLQSAIKLGNRAENKLDVWYIGIDLLGVNRADFDFETSTVVLYAPKAYDITKNKYLLLLLLIAVSIVICVVLFVIFTCMCSKKKQKDIKPGEELMEL